MKREKRKGEEEDGIGGKRNGRDGRNWRRDVVWV